MYILQQEKKRKKERGERGWGIKICRNLQNICYFATKLVYGPFMERTIMVSSEVDALNIGNLIWKKYFNNIIIMILGRFYKCFGMTRLSLAKWRRSRVFFNTFLYGCFDLHRNVKSIRASTLSQIRLIVICRF